MALEVVGSTPIAHPKNTAEKKFSAVFFYPNSRHGISAAPVELYITTLHLDKPAIAFFQYHTTTLAFTL